jgi:cobalt-zinc-cadmium efflux system outer membrane protein
VIALFASWAAAAAPLGLEDVWSSVQATHPLLEAARTRAVAAGQERVAAAGALDPVLSGRVASQLGQYDTQSAGVKAPLGTWWGADLSAGWQRGVGTFDDYEGALKTVDAGEWVLGFDVALLRDAWTDRKRATLRVAGQGVTVVDAEVRQRELELLRTAGQRWTDWEAAGQRLRIAARLLAIAEDRDRAFATQEALGEVPPLVRLDNQRLVLERRERLVQARRAFEQAAIELATWLRDGDGRTLVPAEEQLFDSFEPPAPLTGDDRVERAWAQRPELVRLRAQLGQLDVERRLQANQALPALDVVGKSYLPLDDKYEDEVELGVVAEWTALARTARARREVADANLTRVEAELAFARDRIEADVRDAESAARAADGRVSVARELVATARAVEDGERTKFQLGDSNLIFVNQREIATADAEALLVDAIAAAHRARVDLAWATADLGAP